MKLKINITKEAFYNTRCNLSMNMDDYKKCKKIIYADPISYALKEIFPYCGIDIYDLPDIRSVANIKPFYLTPKVTYSQAANIKCNQGEFLRNFIAMTPFERMSIQPFSFEIELNEWTIRYMDLKKVKEILKSSKTLELIND